MKVDSCMVSIGKQEQVVGHLQMIVASSLNLISPATSAVSALFSNLSQFWQLHLAFASHMSTKCSTAIWHLPDHLAFARCKLTIAR